MRYYSSPNAGPLSGYEISGLVPPTLVDLNSEDGIRKKTWCEIKNNLRIKIQHNNYSALNIGVKWLLMTAYLLVTLYVIMFLHALSIVNSLMLV